MKVAAVLFGAAVPLLVMGRAEIAVSLALATICLILALDWRSNIARLVAWRSAPLALAVAVVLITWLPGVIASSDPWASFAVWLRTGLFAAVAGFCAGAIGGDRNLAVLSYRSLIAASAAAFATALLAIYIHPEFLSYVRLQPDRVYEAAAALKSYANAAMLLLPPLACAAVAMRGRWRWLAAVSAILAVLVVIATHSKAATVGLLAIVAVGLLAAVASERSKPYRVLLIALCLIAAAALFFTVSGKLDVISQRQSSKVTEDFKPYLPTVLVDIHRQRIWAFVFDKAVASPWTGYGINRANTIAGSQALAVDTGRNRGGQFVPSHPHNWLLEIFLETGIVGALATLAAVLWFFGRLLRRYLADKEPLIFAALAVSAGYWGSGLFNFSFWSAWWQVAYFVTIAVMLVNAKGASGKSTAARPYSKPAERRMDSFYLRR